MKNSINRFEFFLDKLNEQLVATSKTDNPALSLFESGARNNLFMLEALSKLFAKLHNENKFEKIEKQVKYVEDALGAIDYYAGFVKDFSGNQAVPTGTVDFLQQRQASLCSDLNEYLAKKDWLKQGDGGKVNKIWRKLKKADWLSEKDEAKAIHKYYEGEINGIKKFIDKTGLPFTKIEAQVHELRRKLRWLSIYPQALLGMVQYSEENIHEPGLDKYLTPEIVNSPFNAFPPVNGNLYLLLVNKNYFLALSWMIAEIGKIKDDGLKYFALAEALQLIENINSDEAMKRAVQLLAGEGKDPEQEILGYASHIAKEYMQAGYLDKILAGVKRLNR